MAKINLPYVLQNGNTADGGQVQQDLDSIVNQVNGNLEGTNNIGTGAIFLANLASEVKVLEAIYSTALTSAVQVPIETVTDIISQSLTLSAARYCLFLITSLHDIVNDVYNCKHYLYDGATNLETWTNFIDSSYNGEETKTFHYFTQLASGSHTIYFKAYQDNNDTVNENIGTRMTIIQFGF